MKVDNKIIMSNIYNPDKDLLLEKPALSLMRMSVGDFVAFVYRRGGLASGSFSTLWNGSGTRIHQQYFKFFKKSQPDSTLYIEYPLKTTYIISPVRFEIQGRADLIVESMENQIQVIEIKTISNDSKLFPEKVDFLHLAQARIYAYLFCLEKEKKDMEIQVTVKYILIDSFKIKDFNELISYHDLERFFHDTCAHYLDWGVSIHNYKILRDASIKDMAFPYAELRQGQKEFMNTVLSCIRKREPLFVQAPTGTGKTISTLYPAIKAIPKQYADFIFYITAKSSTQDVAKKSLDDLRVQGLVLKSIQITAKEKICLCKELYCDTSICPYAIHYYEKYSDAMNELSGHFSIDAVLLQKMGVKYDVCPFELGLDVSLFCDIILCDYNYIFDPKVQLERFIKEESYRFTILVDEAHNLPDRANEMYSASIIYQDVITACHDNAFYSPYTQEVLSKFSKYFDDLFGFLASDDQTEVSFDSSILSKDMFKSPHFCATRKIPKDLLKILDAFVQNSKQEMNEIQDITAKKALTNLFFSAKFFIRVSEEFFSDSYITTFTKEGKNSQINFRCMDSSSQIARFHNGRHSVAFFSATLSPVAYFESKFRDAKSSDSIKKLILPSPFPRENLFVGIVPAISTKYNNRKDSLGSIAEVIVAAISCKVGNYLIYSPSFEYQQWIVYAFEMLMEKNSAHPIKIIKQSPGMNEKIRQTFLNEFKVFGNRTLVAFAVMGGVFGEGIDLVGEKLSGVVLVGVGLPKKSPERDIMMDYYSSILGNGYNFAYRYPGFNKILQAAGRVIRSESDRGFILLLDERYETPEYQALFPDEWDTMILKNKSQIKQAIHEFMSE